MENQPMIKTPPEMRAMTHDLSVSVWSYAAVGVLFESGLAGQMKEPHTVAELAAQCPSLAADRIERLLAVGVALGAVVADGERFRLADGALPFAGPPMGASLRGDIRTTLLQALALLDSASGPAAPPERAWRHTDRALLQGQGDASSGFVPVFKSTMIPAMGDLQSRLDREGARFLDVGVGVASLSIGMCRAFPSLHVLGVDKFEVPLSIARENIARAGLEARIELTQNAIEALDQEASFDLAWLPTVFIDDSMLATATARVCRALRPGGWILYPTGTNAAGTAKSRSVFELVTHLWGGPALSVERATALLQEAGFTSVRTLPGPVWAPAMLVGQRPL
jgi:hypothetical protein